MNDVDPLAWLTQTLERIADRWPISRIDQLCPGTSRTERRQLRAYDRIAGWPATGCGASCRRSCGDEGCSSAWLASSGAPAGLGGVNTPTLPAGASRHKPRSSPALAGSFNPLCPHDLGQERTEAVELTLRADWCWAIELARQYLFVHRFAFCMKSGSPKSHQRPAVRSRPSFKSDFNACSFGPCCSHSG